MSMGKRSILHHNPGISAGHMIDDDGRRVPIVRLTWPKSPRSVEFIESGGKYDPDDGRWYNFNMTIASARRLMSDLDEGIDLSIRGEDNVDEAPEGWETPD